MSIHRLLLLSLSSLLIAFAAARPSIVRADDDLVQTVINLVSDKDKDVRAVGLEQVRDQAKGAEATRRFAAALPKLAPEAQVGLLAALAERGDAAARPAVLDLLAHAQAEVRGAAIHALGALGDSGDVPRLTKLLGDAACEQDAVTALTRLRGAGVNAALCAELKAAAPTLRVKILQLLVARHAVDSVPQVLEAARDADAKVRIAAMEALGQLAGPELVAKLARLILDAKDTAVREETEKSLMLVCQKNPDVDQRAVVLLAFMAKLNDAEKPRLLPALGRIGGKPAREVVEESLGSKDAARRASALRALCHWPDGSVSARLIELALAANDPAERKMLVDALIRVAPLPDKRPDAERLAMLKKAMEFCASDTQRAAVLKRARAIRSLDTLRFVAPYMDRPEFCQLACETVVELAHHKELRQPNKAEFDKALDKVLSLSKDPTVLLRATRYKKDETWVEKQIQGK